jgi:choloylglycine hydrolase
MKNLQDITLLLAGLVILVGFYPNLAHSCSDFQIVTNDSTVIIGRSMEFALDLSSTQILVYPRGEQTVSHTPEGKKGLVWTSKFGFICLGVTLKEIFGDRQLLDDGMNEMGLSAGGLVFHEAKCGNISNSNANTTLDSTDLIPWILGNFASVDEAKEALSGVHIWGMEESPANPYALGFHLAIHDSQGKNIVVEFVNGEMMIYDNPIGVLTNSPSFDYQITNLRNYVNLNPKNAQSIDLHGVRINLTGAGSGSLGMPGDFTPPHRFVRLALYTSWINRPQNASEGGQCRGSPS